MMFKYLYATYVVGLFLVSGVFSGWDYLNKMFLTSKVYRSPPSEPHGTAVKIRVSGPPFRITGPRKSVF